MGVPPVNHQLCFLSNSSRAGRSASVELGLQFPWRDQSPGLVYMKSQLFIADAGELDAHPAGSANVWRSVVFLRRRLDQCFLNTDRSRQYNCDVPVVGG